MESATKMKLAEVLNAGVIQKVKPKEAQPKAAEPVAAPVDNPFYKVLFDPAMSPAQKAEQVAKLVTFTGDKTESRERVKEYNAICAWMQEVREQMARESLSLSDTDTQSVLQGVINDMNHQLLDFEDQMKPLTDITEALYVLRTNEDGIDATTIIRQIRDDKKDEEARREQGEDRDRQVTELEHKIQRFQLDNASLSEKKGFFGYGGLTSAARSAIAVNQVQIDNCIAALERLKTENVAAPAKEPDKYANEKEKVRELLDLTSEEHKERCQSLIKCATDYIDTSKKNVGNVKSHLEIMRTQAEKLLDNSTKLTGVYAILSDGINTALGDGMKERDEIAKPAAGEGAIAMVARNEKTIALDDHLGQLQTAVKATTKSVADMTTQQVRVKGQRDASERMLSTTSDLYSQGIAGVADRLSSTMQAVSQAALGEASEAAKSTLRHMSDLTDKVTQKESIRLAMGVSDMNNELRAALDSLQSYSQVQDAANQITRDGIREIQENLAKIQAAARETQESVKDSYAAAAGTVVSGEAGKPTEASKEKAHADSPFA